MQIRDHFPKITIGIAGFAGVGKNAVCDIVKQGTSGDMRYCTGVMREMVKELHGWDDRHAYEELKDVVDPKFGYAPRKAMYEMGEFGRRLDPAFWIKTHPHLFHHNVPVIIPDLHNCIPSIKEVQKRGGIVIEVRGEKRRKDADTEGHSIEGELPEGLADYVVENNGTIGELMVQVADILTDIINKTEEH